jgi:hypothetical protein
MLIRIDRRAYNNEGSKEPAEGCIGRQAYNNEGGKELARRPQFWRKETTRYGRSI